MKILVHPSEGFSNLSAVKDVSNALMVVVPTEQMRWPSVFALLTILQAWSSMRKIPHPFYVC